MTSPAKIVARAINDLLAQWVKLYRLNEGGEWGFIPTPWGLIRD